ncbi:MAG: hypothetical protein KF859_08810 [Phycisphaeraceae bacterium]|nr:hypothetical protein [Phycisphaeraceae bacterium]
MGETFLLVGITMAVLCLVGAFKGPSAIARSASAVGAAFFLLVGLLLSSVQYVASDQVGIVTRNALGPSLKDGKIIAVDGEMGVQADVLAPGWHVGYWPVMFTVRTVPLTVVESDNVGLIETRDGLPLEDGQLFAPEWPRENFQRMLDARYFLTEGGGGKGKQASVLTPGKYRINTELFRVTAVKQTEVVAGEVAVLKANYGTPPTQKVRIGQVGTGVIADGDDEQIVRLAGPGEMGVRRDVLPPGKYPINTDAFTVTEVWTTQMVAHYTKGVATNPSSASSGPSIQEEQEITVRTSDGFTFPVDVRVEYIIEPRNAPIVVEKLGDDESERFRNVLNSAVRATFRNNAETVRALDYVQQRSQQESQSLSNLAEELSRYGITVTAVRIGNVGDEQSLGLLLKTQTDREIAKQEQLTFKEQQRAAEEKKQLSRAQQEAEEEKRLATSAYAVKIADEVKKSRVTEAQAEAESIRIRAEAQADAYRLIAEQVGSTQAAMIEMLKIVGEKGIQITPRVFINGGGNGVSGDNVNAAFVGTILETLVSKDETTTARPAGGEPRRD